MTWRCRAVHPRRHRLGGWAPGWRVRPSAATAWVFLGLVAGARVPSAAPPAPQAPPAAAGLRILSDATLPAALARACDVRWASDQSVYLGLGVDGAVEVSLRAAAAAPRELIPGGSKAGGFSATHRIAASARYLVAAGPALWLTWRRIDDPVRFDAALEAIQAIDVRDAQLAVVGARRDDQGKFATDGAIAWIGSLDRQLADLKPLLYDAGGSGAPTMNRCIGAELSAIRFLADGSLFVLPGIQPGASLFDRQGKLVRTWDTAALGVDADCTALTEEMASHLAASYERRQLWTNQRRLVDAVLPLAAGPGLLVRTADKGRTRWDLKLLRRDGAVVTVTVPVEGSSEFFALAGDVRAGKIVLLLHEKALRGRERHPPHVLEASLTTG
jgi:hypothetical protein